MKRALMIALFLIVTTFSLSAQLPASGYKNIIGVDVTAFVRQALAFTGNTGGNSIFSVSYRKKFEKNALRFYAGGGSQNQKEILSDTSQRLMRNSQLYVRAGYERWFTITQHFIVTAGCDIMYAPGFYKQDLVNGPGNYSNYLRNKQSVALSPVIGLILQINPRMAFATEGSLNFFRETTRILQRNANTAYTTLISKTDSYGTFINYPVNIEFRFSF